MLCSQAKRLGVGDYNGLMLAFVWPECLIADCCFLPRGCMRYEC